MPEGIDILRRSQVLDDDDLMVRLRKNKRSPRQSWRHTLGDERVHHRFGDPPGPAVRSIYVHPIRVCRQRSDRAGRHVNLVFAARAQATEIGDPRDDLDVDRVRKWGGTVDGGPPDHRRRALLRVPRRRIAGLGRRKGRGLLEHPSVCREPLAARRNSPPNPRDSYGHAKRARILRKTASGRATIRHGMPETPMPRDTTIVLDPNDITPSSRQ